jgi:hypothetical protein
LDSLYAKAGFPCNLNGINTFTGVSEEREQKRTKDDALQKKGLDDPANR